MNSATGANVFIPCEPGNVKLNPFIKRRSFCRFFFPPVKKTVETKFDLALNLFKHIQTTISISSAQHDAHSNAYASHNIISLKVQHNKRIGLDSISYANRKQTTLNVVGVCQLHESFKF